MDSFSFGDESKKFEYQGNVTEVGILKFFQGVMGCEGIINIKNELTEERIIQIVPFDSGRKRGSIVVSLPDGGVRVYTKGAPDVLFNKDQNLVAAKA